MKFNLDNFTTPIIYRRTNAVNNTKLLAYFWQNRSNYYYDEYPTSVGTTYGQNDTVYGFYSILLTPAPDQRYAGPYPFREISAQVVTHDIGNGESDFQLDKIILDAQYDTKTYRNYAYQPTEPGFISIAAYDPKLTFESRNTTYANETPVLQLELIQKNYQALQWVNPWRSRLNTPGGTTASSAEISNGDVIHRESLALVTPFLKYRRGRIYLETAQKMTTVRGIQVYATEFSRKTYG